jgi:hypothetical protein
MERLLRRPEEARVADLVTRMVSPNPFIGGAFDLRGAYATVIARASAAVKADGSRRAAPEGFCDVFSVKYRG